MSVLTAGLQKLRASIPAGFVLGRQSTGTGPVELISFSDLFKANGAGSNGAPISAYLMTGTHAARPTNPGLPTGTTGIYYETDTTNWFGWTGSAWAQINASSSGGATGENANPTNPGWDPDYAWVMASGTITAIPLTSSNTIATMVASATSGMLIGTPGRLSGKRYFEVKMSASDGAAGITLGWGRDNLNTDGGYFGQHIGQIGWYSGGAVNSRSQLSTFGGPYTITTIQSWANNNTLCVAVDLDAHLIWFRTNAGNWNNSGSANPATGIGGIDLNKAKQHAVAPLMWYPGASTNTSAATGTINLVGSFAQSVPSGFNAWSS